jgi:hypothetical protein
MSNNTTTALDFFASLYASGLDKYSVSRRYPNLHFTDTGMTRLAMTVGWLMGREEREVLAGWLDERLTYLNGYGAEEGKAPRFRVSLSDDRLPGSWSIAWFGRTDKVEGSHMEMNIERWENNEYKTVLYSYAWNGGLIFHGGGETFTVRLGDDSNPWGIHT